MRDLNGKKVELGCGLKSKMFPENEVECVGFQDKSPLLQQLLPGSAPFKMPKKSQWFVCKEPDKDTAPLEL